MRGKPGFVAVRPLQCGTEGRAGGQEERAEPLFASGASGFCFRVGNPDSGSGSGAKKAALVSQPAVMMPEFGSGTPRSDSGFEATMPGDESGTETFGSGGSETLP